jgi:hypothetical protein
MVPAAQMLAVSEKFDPEPVASAMRAAGTWAAIDSPLSEERFLCRGKLGADVAICTEALRRQSEFRSRLPPAARR